MQRPKILFAVALWTFLMSPFYLSDPLAFAGAAAGLDQETMKVINGVLKLVVVGLLIGLVRLWQVSRVVFW